MKKTTSIILCAMVLFAALVLAGCDPGVVTNEGAATAAPSATQSAEATTVPITGTLSAEKTEFIYEVKNGEVTVTRVAMTQDGELSIPEQIEGMPVVAIGENALDGIDKLDKVQIPETVRVIPDHIFDRLDPVLYVWDNTPAMEYVRTHPFEFRLVGSDMDRVKWSGVEYEGYLYVSSGPGIVRKDLKSGTMRVLVPKPEESFFYSELIHNGELYFMDLKMLKKVGLDGGEVTDVWESPLRIDAAGYESYDGFIYGTDMGSSPSGSMDGTMVRLDPETGETKWYENIEVGPYNQFFGGYYYCASRGTLYRVDLETGGIEILWGRNGWVKDTDLERVTVDGTEYAVDDLPYVGHLPTLGDFFFVGDELCYTTVEFEHGRPFGVYRYQEGSDDVSLAEWESTDDV